MPYHESFQIMFFMLQLHKMEETGQKKNNYVCENGTQPLFWPAKLKNVFNLMRDEGFLLCV